MNIVGTPWKQVIFSWLMQFKPLRGENAVIGDIVTAWVTEAVIARTMPKQWNIGTWIITDSRTVTAVQTVFLTDNSFFFQFDTALRTVA